MKSVTLSLDIPELSEPLVRTGVPSDGSCFFHAYLLATENHYRSLPLEEQYKQVVALRQNLSTFVTKDVWKLLGNVTTVETERMVVHIIEQLYRKTGWENIDKDVWEVLSQIFTQEEVENTLLPIREDSEERLRVLIEKNVNLMLSGQDSAEDIVALENLKKVALEFFNSVIEYADLQALEQFKKNLADPSTQTDEKMLVAIREYSDYDFLFLNGTTRKSYNTGLKMSGTRPILIVLWINECHYESVGRLLSGNKIQRLFSSSDSLVKILENH